MRVWIVNYYTSPDCSNPRYLQLAKYFTEYGWEVTTYYANYQNNENTAIFDRQQVNGYEKVHVKATQYIRNDVGRRRYI